MFEENVVVCGNVYYDFFKFKLIGMKFEFLFNNIILLILRDFFNGLENIY